MTMVAGIRTCGGSVANDSRRTFHSSRLSLLRSRLHVYYRSQNPVARRSSEAGELTQPVRNHMENPEVLKREIKALAFDQYGTIVDMQKGLTEAVTPFLKQKAWDGSP